MLIRGKVPLRVSFTGGGTDVAPYCDDFGGAVLSSTINMYAYATIEPREDNEVQILSLDYDTLIKYDVNDSIRYDGRLDLLKAIISRMGLKQGINLFIHNDAPPGSGLGSSGAIATMIVSMVAKLMGRKMNRYDVANLAVDIERNELGVPGGKQDQFAAVFGGFNFIEFSKDRTLVHGLRIDREIVRELEYHLLLVYTKKNHYSGDLIQAQVDLYNKKDEQHLEGLHELKNFVFLQKEALLFGNLGKFAEIFHQGWLSKKKMNPLTTTDYVDEIYSQALKLGALGGKVLGAGGGGYILLFCPFNKKHLISKRVEEMGAKVVPFSFESEGLQTWTVSRADIALSKDKTILEIFNR
jgi:D-glycero-alpha-D-manno-heptose-7-phosphate kinase